MADAHGFAETHLPEVNEVRCLSSGDCIRVCPVGCLELDGPLPWLARPQDCVSCALCAMVCPANAIQLRAVDP
jgi:NAD-dependent dihydropyrimidine dehydrogenase PreA subunit